MGAEADEEGIVLADNNSECDSNFVDKFQRELLQSAGGNTSAARGVPLHCSLHHV